MRIPLTLLFLFLHLVALSQQPSPTDKAYIFNDSLVVLGTDYILRSDLKTPNNFFSIQPYSATNQVIKDLSMLIFKGNELLIDAATNAVFKLEKDTIKSWVAPESAPAIGATYLVKNDTLFRYGGKKEYMNIDYLSFLNEETLRWQVFPSFNSAYTPNGTFNNCYAENLDYTVFVRGSRVNRRNLSDEYLDDHIVAYDWRVNEWFEWGHTRAAYQNFHSSIAMGEQLLFYNEKSMFLINPFENTNTLYYRNLVHLNMNKHDTLDALYHQGVFYTFLQTDQGIFVKPIPQATFLPKIAALDSFYDPPSEEGTLYFYLLGGLLLCITLYSPIKKLLYKDKIKLTKKGLNYAGVLHPIQHIQYLSLKLLLESETVPTAALMKIIENPNISYSQNMKIKNQLIAQLNTILQTILNISEPIIIEIKDKNDQRVTLYQINATYFRKL